MTWFNYTIALLLSVLAFASANAQGQDVHQLLREADKSYWNGKYSKADSLYGEAEKLDPARLSPSYNRGNSQMMNGKHEQAEETYRRAAQKAQTNPEKAAALHNLGNALLEQQKLKEAEEAYKQSLKLNPGDGATAKNLAITRIKQQQQQQQNGQGKSEDEQKDNQNQENQQQDQQQNQNQNEKNDQQSNENQQQTNNEQPQEPGEPERAKGEDELLLRIAEQEEQKVQEKLQKQQKNKLPPNGKDW